MADQQRTKISGAIDRIDAALDTIEEEPHDLTVADYKRFKEVLGRMMTLDALESWRFSENARIADICQRL